MLDALAERHGVEWESAPRGIEGLSGRWRIADAVLAKPLTFMNLSGGAVVGLMQFYKVEVVDLLVVVDDVNLDLGRLRARSMGSAGGHNGLKSVIEQLGTTEVPRLRVGVGRGDARGNLVNHVLSAFSADERSVIEAATLRAADAVELFVHDGIERVMSTFNAASENSQEETG